MSKVTKKLKKLPKWAIITIIVIVALLLLITPDSDPRKTVVSQNADSLELIALPTGDDGQIIQHAGYTLSYAEEFEQPWWVAYVMTPEEAAVSAVDRDDDFREDPAVATGSATLSDYKGSGYDRGHMAPFADLSWSAQSGSESFFLSNMSPQAGELNQRKWADLEAVVRTFALSGPICVVTGPVLTDGPYKTIGSNKVAVPNWYFKVILDYTNSRAIAFLMPNENCPKKLEDYVVTVNEVEALTGLDFFSRLDDDVEERLESYADPSVWDFSQYSAKVAKKYGYNPDTMVVTERSYVLYETLEPETAVEKIRYYLYVYLGSLKKEVVQSVRDLVANVKDDK